MLRFKKSCHKCWGVGSDERIKVDKLKAPTTTKQFNKAFKQGRDFFKSRETKQSWSQLPWDY